MAIDYAIKLLRVLHTPPNDFGTSPRCSWGRASLVFKQKQNRLFPIMTPAKHAVPSQLEMRYVCFGGNSGLDRFFPRTRERFYGAVSDFSGTGETISRRAVEKGYLLVNNCIVDFGKCS